VKEGLFGAVAGLLVIISGYLLGEWQVGLIAAALSFLPFLGFALYRQTKPILASAILLGGVLLRLFAVFPLAVFTNDRGLLVYLGGVGFFLFFEVVSQALLRISGRTRT